MSNRTFWQRFIAWCKDDLFWYLMPGVNVTVKWPVVSPVSLGFDQDGDEIVVSSADPNDHYRPWLEENVGKQGLDWQWRIGYITKFGFDSLDVKIRYGKTKYATIAAMKWG